MFRCSTLPGVESLKLTDAKCQLDHFGYLQENFLNIQTTNLSVQVQL